MDERIEKFLQKEKEIKSSDWERLWPFLAVRLSLGLSLDKEIYHFFNEINFSNHDFIGKINEDNSIKCESCESISVFTGSYISEEEKDRYAVLGGTDDEDNYYTSTNHFFICLKCGSMAINPFSDSRFIFIQPDFENNCKLFIPDLHHINLELIEYFGKHPEMLYKLDWRKFEELLEAVFKNQGYRTKIGPGSNDKGIDLLLIQKDTIGDLVTIVQAKKYSPDYPIKLEAVQALSAVVQDNKANRGLFVTTSRYLPGVKEFAERQQSLITLATSEEVAKWCRSFRL